jgi:hypothetical protein
MVVLPTLRGRPRSAGPGFRRWRWTLVARADQTRTRRADPSSPWLTSLAQMAIDIRAICCRCSRTGHRFG